jgi:hypothetical protein
MCRRDCWREYEALTVSCKVGMATAAALFRLEQGEARMLAVDVSLTHDPQVPDLFPAGRQGKGWAESLRHTSRLQIPDAHLQFLYEAAIRALVLHSPRSQHRQAGEADGVRAPPQ